MSAGTGERAFVVRTILASLKPKVLPPARAQSPAQLAKRCESSLFWRAGPPMKPAWCCGKRRCRPRCGQEVACHYAVAAGCPAPWQTLRLWDPAAPSAGSQQGYTPSSLRQQSLRHALCDLQGARRALTPSRFPVPSHASPPRTRGSTRTPPTTPHDPIGNNTKHSRARGPYRIQRTQHLRAIVGGNESAHGREQGVGRQGLLDPGGERHAHAQAILKVVGRANCSLRKQFDRSAYGVRGAERRHGTRSECQQAITK
eukprot:scaffold2694_cov336-Prasinococcus_capsulatus_cf.AAC.1